MELLDAIINRKSVRAFKSDPVPTEAIKKILEISCRAPSSVNTQPGNLSWLKARCWKN